LIGEKKKKYLQFVIIFIASGTRLASRQLWNHTILLQFLKVKHTPKSIIVIVLEG
jgi:hypothetical protein